MKKGSDATLDEAVSRRAPEFDHACLAFFPRGLGTVHLGDEYGGAEFHSVICGKCLRRSDRRHDESGEVLSDCDYNGGENYPVGLNRSARKRYPDTLFSDGCREFLPISEELLERRLRRSAELWAEHDGFVRRALGKNPAASSEAVGEFLSEAPLASEPEIKDLLDELGAPA
jgi:hypothetical protein